MHCDDSDGWDGGRGRREGGDACIIVIDLRCRMAETWQVGKTSWRRAWQATPVFLPGEFHGQRSLVGYDS